ncbi:hypothetical protein [Ensifer aridi]|uniref:hypothetical protein n=1 Tax=Ensifer aridi TaxID=1708715 RepID=UPI00047891FF|nr:hypothetical protein [Ensifer aridi]
MLTHEHMRSTHRLARFVGLETYEAAGGAIVRDLFGEDSGTFLTDQPLLTRLAMDALEQAEAPLTTEGWKWVETSLEASTPYSGGYERIYPQTRTDRGRADRAFGSGGDLREVQAHQIEAYAEGDPPHGGRRGAPCRRKAAYPGHPARHQGFRPQETLAGCFAYQVRCRSAGAMRQPARFDLYRARAKGAPCGPSLALSSHPLEANLVDNLDDLVALHKRAYARLNDSSQKPKLAIDAAG